MSNGTIMIICGIGIAVISSLIFIFLKIWLYSYEKKVKKELGRRYE